MKKLIILTAVILIAVFNFDPAYGQRGKRGSKKTMTKEDSAKSLNPMVEDPKEEEPANDKIASLTLADVVARLEKIEQGQKASEKSIGSIKKELKAGKMSILDSMRKLRNESEKSNSGLLLNISNLDDKLKKELASNAEFMMILEAKADSGNNEAQHALVELQKISEGNTKQSWINRALCIFILLLVVYSFLTWKDRKKMKKTIDNLKPAYGDPVGSTGNQFRSQQD